MFLVNPEVTPAFTADELFFLFMAMITTIIAIRTIVKMKTLLYRIGVIVSQLGFYTLVTNELIKTPPKWLFWASLGTIGIGVGISLLGLLIVIYKSRPIDNYNN